MAWEKQYLGICLVLGFSTLSNAQGKSTVKVYSIEYKPYLIKTEDGEWEGFIPDLLDLMQFNYSLSQPPDGKYGLLLPDQSWSGMIGALTMQQVDIAGLLTVTEMRSRVVDFSHPVMTSGPSALIKKSKTPPRRQLDENFSRLLEPLEVSVWLLAVLALLITGAVLFTISYFNPYEWRRLARDGVANAAQGESFTALNSLWFVFSTLMWQGYRYPPRSVGARVLALAWFIFSAFFIAAYIASLTNYLQRGFRHAVAMGRPMDTFSDIAADDNMKVAMIHSGANYQYFKQSKTQTEQKIYEKYVHFRNESKTEIRSMTELVNALDTHKGGSLALIIDYDAAKYYAGRDCSLHVIRSEGRNVYQAFGFPKQSALREQFNLKLLQLSETGKLQSLENKWFLGNQCARDLVEGRVDAGTYEATDLMTMSVAFFVLLAGMVLGVLVTLLEICIYRKADKVNSKGTRP